MTGITRRKVLVLAALVVVGIGLQNQVSGGDLFRRIFSRSKCRSSVYTYQRQPDCHTPYSPKLADSCVCAVVEWGEHDDGSGGTYCSYYAIGCPSYAPYNMDANCGLPVPGDCSNCPPLGSDLACIFTGSFRSFKQEQIKNKHHCEHPDRKGIKKCKKNYKIEINNKKVHYKKLDELIVSFPINGTPRYAKLFLYRVKPKESVQHPRNEKWQWAYMAVGCEIEEIEENEIETQLNADQVKDYGDLAQLTVGTVTFQINLVPEKMAQR